MIKFLHKCQVCKKRKLFVMKPKVFIPQIKRTAIAKDIYTCRRCNKKLQEAINRKS